MGAHSPVYDLFSQFLAAAAANDAQVTPLHEQLIDILHAGPAARAVNRALVEPVMEPEQEGLYVLDEDSLCSEVLSKCASAKNDVETMFGLKLVILLVSLADEPVARPFCVKLADGTGFVFLPDGIVETEVLRHELAHLACISGHPVFDEGVASLAEGTQDRQAESAPMDFARACSLSGDDDLRSLSQSEHAGFRAAAQRIVLTLAKDGELASLCSLARDLRGIRPGANLQNWLHEHSANNPEDAWGPLDQTEARSASAVADFVEHNADKCLRQAKNGADSPYDQFLFSSVALFNYPAFWEVGPALLERYELWRDSARPSTLWQGAERALADFYIALEAAFRADGGTDAPEKWWLVDEALTKMLGDYSAEPEVAAAAMIYFARQPGADQEDFAKIHEIGAVFSDDPQWSASMNRLVNILC